MKLVLRDFEGSNEWILVEQYVNTHWFFCAFLEGMQILQSTQNWQPFYMCVMFDSM